MKPASFIVLAISLMLALAFPVGASAQPAAAAAPETAASRSAGDRNYVLGVGDVVEVGVIGRSDFNSRVRIGSDGNIVLPLLGTVQAINRTPGQLADELRAALQAGGFYSQPVVRVEVVGVQSSYVTVLGAVVNPGLLPLDRQYRLSEILARVGGKSSGAADVAVLTTGGKSARYKISDLAMATSEEQDPIVRNGDKLYVPAAENEVFYLTGAVRTPGVYPLSAGTTVRIALARGGGVSEMGNAKKVKINRNGEYLKNVDLDKTTVEPGDILTVGERLF